MIIGPLRSLLLAGTFATAGAVPLAAQNDSLARATDTTRRAPVPRAGRDATLFDLLDGCRAQPVPSDSGGGPRIVISPLGQVLQLKGPINEGDSLRVVVLGHKDLLPRLVVTRTSSARVPGTVNVVGQPRTLAIAPRTPVDCSNGSWTLRDFAPGIGQFEVTVFWPTKKPEDRIGYTPQSLAKIGFPVHALYWGALSFGPIVTGLENPAYVARVSVSDTTIAYATRPGARIEYALFYSGFPSARDIETDREVQVDPVIGLVLSDIPNNLLLGLSVHVGYSFYGVFGAQGGLVRRLDDTSGLRLGARIHTLAASIPVDNRFEVSWFAGFGLDLRAAGKLFSLVSK